MGWCARRGEAGEVPIYLPWPKQAEGHAGSAQVRSVQETDQIMVVGSVLHVAKHRPVDRQASCALVRWQHALCDPVVPFAWGSHGTASVYCLPVTV